MKYIFVAAVLLLLIASDCSYELTTEADPPAGGIVLRDDTSGTSPKPYGSKAQHQDSVKLEAVPNPGFVFSHWEHNNSESPVLEFNMRGSKMTRMAVFIPDPANIVPAGPPPTAIIDSPTEGTHLPASTQITFSGSATDVGDGPLTGGSLIWSSNLDGQLGTGESFDRSLSSGAHMITLTATNSVAVSGTASIGVTVGDITNRLPLVTIESPAPGGIFLTSEDIAFSGSADDLEDGVLAGASLVWTSDLDGEIGTGEAFSATLTEGSHRITLTATDSQQGERSPFIDIIVEAPAGPLPTATIFSPAVGETFLSSDSIVFSGSANEADGSPMSGALLTWTSILDGELGTGASISASLSVGNHVIAFDATNSQGVTVSASVGIIIEGPPNGLPTASIVSPANGDTFLTTGNIVFSGSANDPEDGPLIANFLVWSSTVGGQIGTGGSFSAALGVGQHTITLTATDSQGATGTESISITVAPPPNRPPTASIESPIFGETFQTSDNIAFQGIGNDSEEGLLEGLHWCGPRTSTGR